jgi:hypothetical protein
VSQFSEHVILYDTNYPVSSIIANERPNVNDTLIPDQLKPTKFEFN